MNRIRSSNFFGLLIDESIDTIIIGHLIVLATFVENGFHMSVFLGLLEINNGRKDAQEFFYYLFLGVKEWGLDLQKYVSIEFDGASIMIGNKTGIANRLQKVSPFVTSIHSS